MTTVKKVIIPVAGLGTRLFPLTKVTPKELLPVVNKAIIQYALEEVAEAGITEVIIVTNESKRLVSDYLGVKGQVNSDAARPIDHREFIVDDAIAPKRLIFRYVQQARPLGLGHAILCAASFINDESFAVLLPDDLIYTSKKGCMKQMVDSYTDTSMALLAVEEVDKNEISNYGVVLPGAKFNQCFEVKEIIEKPSVENAPSNFGVVGRYILPAKIMKVLETVAPGTGNEIQLTDALAAFLNQGSVAACEFSGNRFDCGSNLGLLKANVFFAVNDPLIGKTFRDWLKEHLDCDGEALI